MHPHHHLRHTRQQQGEPLLVAIRVLGGFGVTVNGVPTPTHGWSRRAAAALVKILALAPGHHLHREQVMDLLWPDDPITATAPRLHKAAHFARRAAGRDDAVVLRDDVVWLFPGADVTVDALRFEELAQVAVAEDDPRAAREALEWYRGDLLPGDRYEDWAADRREVLHLRRLDVLRVAGDWRKLAELDPTNEDAHLELMRRHVAGGDHRAAARQYAYLERVLERELGVVPGDHAVRAVFGGNANEGSHVADLLGELAELITRENAVLAELAAVSVAHRHLTVPTELMTAGHAS